MSDDLQPALSACPDSMGFPHAATPFAAHFGELMLIEFAKQAKAA